MSSLWHTFQKPIHKPPIYVITPTFPRAVQIPELTRYIWNLSNQQTNCIKLISRYFLNYCCKFWKNTLPKIKPKRWGFDFGCFDLPRPRSFLVLQTNFIFEEDIIFMLPAQGIEKSWVRSGLVLDNPTNLFKKASSSVLVKTCFWTIKNTYNLGWPDQKYYLNQ